jgi:hypothetical protein
MPAYARMSINEHREQPSEKDGTPYRFDVPKKDVCVGCQNTGDHLDTECLVRPCAFSRRLQDCSFCDHFESCETLRTRADIIEKIKQKNTGQISKEEYALFFRPYEGRAELKKQRKRR